MLTRVPVPWTNAYGIARTLIALGTAGTLLFSSTATLFRPVATLGDHPRCEGLGSAGAFCLVPREHLGWMQWACVIILLITASGWRPRLTALPHAYVAFSVFTGISLVDGGDQLAAILALLLTLPALGDPRRWHWHPLPEDPTPATPSRRAWALAGVSALVMVRLQMSFVYFQASIAKLPHAEWADGSGMYYWANGLSFGAPHWMRPVTEPLVSHPWGTALLTWIPLFIEIALAATLLIPQRYRWHLLAAGLAFHFCIATMMGLWSFALTMWGGLFLLCLPLGGALHRTPKETSETAADPAEENMKPNLAATASHP